MVLLHMVVQLCHKRRGPARERKWVHPNLLATSLIECTCTYRDARL